MDRNNAEYIKRWGNQNYFKIGDRFGLWTVIRIPPIGKMILCRCDCGVEREVSKHKLLNGLSTSCGCDKENKKIETFMAKYGVPNPLQAQGPKQKMKATYAKKNADSPDALRIGDKFGEWTVVELIPGIMSYVWAQCSCGKRQKIRASALRNGQTTCCNQCKGRKISSNLRSKSGIEPGHKFNDFTVLGPDPVLQGYRCQCVCTKVITLRLSVIRAESRQDCGHPTDRNFSTGTKFGVWTALEDSTGKTYVLCRCDCGVERKVNKQTLLRGESLSCGCVNRRHG